MNCLQHGHRSLWRLKDVSGHKLPHIKMLRQRTWNAVETYKALSWRVARPQRPHPRPRGLLFRQRRAARKHAVGPAAWTCGYRRQKRSGGAGIAHDGRGRRSGLRGVVVARLVRAARTPPEIVRKISVDTVAA